jgi:hypothetical protein
VDVGDKLTKELKAARAKAKESPINRKIRAKYPKTLHKELLGWRDGQGNPPVDPQETLYRWWWEFLRAADQHPEVRTEALGTGPNAQAKADDLAKTKVAFGDLGDKFGPWWHRVGEKIFAEDTIPLIHVIKPLPDDEAYKRDVGVVMIVPMTISRRLLIEQFKVVLDVYHPNADFKRHEASTAKVKLHPRKRDIEVDYDQLLKVWRAKRANDKLPADQRQDEWQVYCDALGLSNRKKQLSVKKASLERAKLAKELHNLYAQADDLMQSAVLGQFPNDERYQASKGRLSAAERRSKKKDAQTGPNRDE